MPGLRGGIRLGGQQSDYTGLAIDGGDARDNFFGEFFGSLETKNFTIPLEAVQEFQVVTNGFAPEFGRSTGGPAERGDQVGHERDPAAAPTTSTAART